VSQEPGQNGRPFPRCIQSLAHLSLRQSGADGFAIYQLDPDGGQVLIYREGPADGLDVASFPLKIDDGAAATLSFVFCNTSIGVSTQLLLERIARAIESVWQFSRAPERYAQMALRIGELEVELADAKIADRASGMLQDAAASRDPIAAIVHHVESVLRPSELENALGKFERDLAEQLAERQLTTRAKAVLQSRYGISEEQAHVHLRVVSRTSRKRLRDVAQALIENPNT
jgi:ANTAR domain